MVDEATKAIQEQIDNMAATVAQNKVNKCNKPTTMRMDLKKSWRMVKFGVSFICSVCFSLSLPVPLAPSLQESVRTAQEELAKQKEVIVAQDKEVKVSGHLHFSKDFASNVTVTPFDVQR